MHTAEPGIWLEILKKVENEKHIVASEIWREILKNVKMRNA
jgi:hypothetical protein